MSTIYLATSNLHKVQELKELISNEYIIKPISELINNFDPVESGSTFIENSVIKAVTAGNLTHKPVLADDSGLCIEALDGFPGIKSARFMKEYSYEDKMNKIIQMLEGKNKRAFFACAATYYDPKTYTLLSYEGRVYGNISTIIQGINGFGYDPIFIPDGYDKSFGLLDTDIKKDISHRANAFKGLFNLIEKLK